MNVVYNYSIQYNHKETRKRRNWNYWPPWSSLRTCANQNISLWVIYWCRLKDPKISFGHIWLFDGEQRRLCENVFLVFGIVAHLQFLRNISRSWLSTPAADPLHKFPPLKYLQILHHRQRKLFQDTFVSVPLWGLLIHKANAPPPPHPRCSLSWNSRNLSKHVRADCS